MEKFQLIKVSLIYESDTNPRKINVNDPEFKDFTASVKEKGVIVPIIVREKPKDNKVFEAVIGNRRLRAANLTGKEEIRAMIRDLTDNEARELQIIENLQRSDVHPLDEAEGYRSLLEKTGQTIPELAKRMGKSETYIRQRLKMTDLVDKAKEMFRKEKITVGHAILIARLQPADQAKVLGQLKWGDRDVADIKEWIEENIMLDLHSAPFKKEECKSCSKRTGSMPSLFPDIKKTDICIDPICFETKMQTHIASLIEDAKKEGIKLAKVSTESSYRYGEKPKAGVLPKELFHIITGKNDKCDFCRKAVVVEGGNRGQLVEICDSSDCKMHRREKGDSYRKTPAEIKREKERRRQEEAKKKKEDKELAAALKKLKWPPTAKQIDVMVEIVLAWNGIMITRPIVKRHGWEVRKSTHAGWDNKKVTQPDYEKTIKEEAAKMTEVEKLRLIVEILLERTWNKNKIIKMF